MEQAHENDFVLKFEFGDELDLHQFSPKDVKDLVLEYLDHASLKGWKRVRIIHGKGTGTLRRIVYAILERHPGVASFQQGSTDSGGWGAVIVYLKVRK